MVLKYIFEDENQYITVPISEKTLKEMSKFIKDCMELDSELALDKERERREQMIRDNLERDGDASWESFRKTTYGE